MKAATVVLVMAFAVLLFNSGARFAIGLLLPPMEQELGWTRTTLSLMVTVFMIVSAGFLPFIGRLVDRLGARRVLVFGVVLSGLSVAGMAFVQHPAQAMVLYGLLFAIGSAATSVTPIGVLLVRWFPNRMGMANSVAISGMGMGQLVIIAGLSSQLLVLGWRGSFALVGAASVAAVLPLVLFAGRGETPPRRPKATDAEGDTEPGRTLGQAASTWAFWLVLMIYAICGFQDFLIATHVVAFAIDEGVSLMFAGNMLALMGLAGLVGVLISGALNDRYGPAVPTAFCFVIRIVIFALMLISRDITAITVMALLYGSTFWMTAPLAVVFARRLCRAAMLGTLSGIITLVHHMWGGAGAFVAARLYDLSGSYDVSMLIMLIVSVVALLLTLGVWNLGRGAT